MEKRHEPQVGAHFKVNRWNENSLEQLKTELLKEISRDEHIADASGIDLELATEGNEVTRIRLTGTVGTVVEAARAARIVEANTHDEVEVQNDLVPH
jgi:hypothetical protein